MPTGEDQRNPRGLMTAARETRERTAQLQAQVDGFLARLADAPDLAEAFDDAVMREDRDAVVELLRTGGLEGEITIDRIEADRRMDLHVCIGLTVESSSCIHFAIEW
jgi:hypothetical protein